MRFRPSLYTAVRLTLADAAGSRTAVAREKILEAFVVVGRIVIRGGVLHVPTVSALELRCKLARAMALVRIVLHAIRRAGLCLQVRRAQTGSGH